MKKLFILFFAVGLLTACNNNPFAPKGNNAKTLEKDEKKTGDDKKDNDDGKDDKSGDDDYAKVDDDKSNWTNKQRNKWMSDCVNEIENNPQAKQICSCVLEKAEKKYPDAADAENATEAEGEKWGRACLSEINGGGNDDDNNDITDTRRINDDDNTIQGNNENAWTSLQRKQFIQGCATTARQAQGFTSEQANSYCDCMTRKVERKYSFIQAAKLKPEDFQTQEWQNAAADCRSGIY